MKPPAVAVYLALGPADLRGAFDQLCAVTRKVLQQDPASGALFLFTNRRRNRIKALWWDRNGYAILYKRLARGTFPLGPFEQGAPPCIEITAADFARIVAGTAPATRGSDPSPAVH